MVDLIPSFLYALLKHWVALMSGIVSLTINIVLRARGREPRNEVFWSIAALCLFIACFLAWADEHNMRNQAQQELTEVRDRAAPRLTCEIEKVIIGEEPNTKLAQIFVYLTVRNVGTSQSIAEKYKLHIKAPDFEYSERPTDISEEYRLTTEDKTKNVTFLQQDSLVKKTETPIENGNKKEGWLRFVMQMKEVTPDFIRRPGIKYTISLADVNGKTCSAEYVMPKNTQSYAELESPLSNGDFYAALSR